MTPLHCCINPAVAKLLIAGKANVNARSIYGLTPLHRCDDLKIALLLINNGADVDAISNYGETPLSGCGNRTLAGLLIDIGAETIGVTNRYESINALIQSKATELLIPLTELPNDIQQLTTQQKAFITHLTAPKKVGDPLVPLEVLNNKNLVDYMREEKPNLLQFAWEYHEDKIFNGVANPIEFNHSLEVMALSTIIKSISEKSELDIDDRNTLRAYYKNAKRNLLLTNGSVFKQQQTAPTKIQALGRGHIVRQRNMALARWFTPSPQNKYLPNPCTIS